MKAATLTNFLTIYEIKITFLVITSAVIKIETLNQSHLVRLQKALRLAIRCGRAECFVITLLVFVF